MCRILVLLVYVFLFISSCSDINEYGTWNIQIKQEITLLEQKLNQWHNVVEIRKSYNMSEYKDDEELLIALANADDTFWDTTAKVFTLSQQIERSILTLWELSGRCLYDDISGPELLANTNVIIDRYRKFIKENSKPSREIFIDNFEENIEAIRTEYCWPAVAIIQKYVKFKNIIRIADGLKLFDIHPDQRTKAYHAMKEWYAENNERIKWNPFLEKFTLDGKITSFNLPDPVINAIKSIGR